MHVWRIRLVLMLLCICAPLGAQNANAQIFLTDEQLVSCGSIPPTTFGDLMLAGDFVFDAVIIVAAPATLPAPVRLAVYAQAPIPFATDTELPGYQVGIARALSSFSDSFGGPLDLTFSYDEGTFGFDETALHLLELDIALGRWIALPSDLDTAQNTISALVDGPGLYGIGGPGSFGGPVAVAVSLLPRAALVALLLTFLVAGAWILSKGAGGGTVGMFLLVLLALPVIAVALKPEFTTPGNKPINHIEKVSVTDVEIGAPPVTHLCLVTSEWRYDGAGDATKPANWIADLPLTVYVRKAGAVEPIKRGNAKPVGAYDKTKDPFYDCAGYALRDSAYVPSDPNADGRNIIEKEYDEKGKLGDGGFQEGDILTYKKGGKITHYAVVTDVDDKGKIKKCKSKWGKSYVYEHSPGKANVPKVYGDPDKVYRKKAE